MTASKVRAAEAEGGSTGISRLATIVTDEEPGVFAAERDASMPDDVFQILRNARRRHAIRILADRGGSVELSDLASTIASIENGKTRDEVDAAERKRVYISLYQCHVSRMADAGFVEYDDESRTVAITPRGTELAAALQTFASRGRGRSRAHLGVAIVAVALSATVFYGGATGPAMLLLGIALSFGATGLLSGVSDLAIRPGTPAND